MKEPKPVQYKTLEGLSEKQLAEHHDVLYIGYVKKWNEIQEKLKSADRAAANGTYSEFGELKREETFAMNGIKLHEGYFDNMIPAYKQEFSEPSGKTKELMERDFGSYEKWQEDFKALGVAARGWVVLAYDLDENGSIIISAIRIIREAYGTLSRFSLWMCMNTRIFWTMQPHGKHTLKCFSKISTGCMLMLLSTGLTNDRYTRSKKHHAGGD